MFRMMRNGNQKVKVYGWGILKNGWEYYYLDDKHNADIRTALVIGFENEIGDVSQREIQPYLWSYVKGNDLNDLAPAPEWEWE